MRTFVLLALLILAVAPVADADTTYSYTSGAFAVVSGIYTPDDRIRGYFTVADNFVPEPYVLRDFTAGVVAYSFTDGHQTLTQANSTGRFSLSLFVGVDEYAFWGVAITNPEIVSAPPFCPEACVHSFISTYQYGDRDDFGVLNSSSFGWSVAGVPSPPETRGTRGVWTVTVPEPSALVLTALGLTGLAGLAASRAWVTRAPRNSRASSRSSSAP
ncbi:MAG: hypothetical protein AUH77_02360 [Candidatus Rokubacteria bacterium 13_1_40CM_4_69_39]|nr:MAG: hypothetical protein AUH77_02360 [Candidatus Rokubacteria bacterium 13_1_40CM_4_69_39]PYM50092.1 MAG: hypothetical protein DME14_06670 [Candidatus Rokubacteria bacterium]